MKKNKGFTLVELIIVIAIIAVLAAVLAPQYMIYAERAREANDLQIATNIIKATGLAIADPQNGVPSNRLIEVMWNTGPEVNPRSDVGTVLIRYPDSGGRKSVLKGTIPSLSDSDLTEEQKENLQKMILEILGIEAKEYSANGGVGYYGMMAEAESDAGKSTSFVIHVDSTTGQAALASWTGTAGDWAGGTTPSNYWIDIIGVEGVLRAP